METLLPIDLFDGSRPLLALDVDGVINVFEENTKKKAPSARLTRVLVRTAHGQKYVIDFDADIIAALDDTIRTHQIELGWLTTWGPNARALVDQALGGKLAGGFVLAKIPPRVRGFRDARWKLNALRARVAHTGQPFIWADDVEIAGERLINRAFNIDDVAAGIPGLLIATDEAVGITAADVADIDRFCTAHS
ncbi:HAD domain-containing protein [Leifsonia sp. Leaf264]|uniref:HAD domain-containing protein n=1 Tax=Leifsonia sp. Leaf264 TaxID=1736314 RepID=UPI0006F7BD13|nr:HAD domain-containing protein [Leifsonia sp. Leaf264]KQO98804.1 hypothetical protein ASF30_12135 [Leifsonia sp. Leaf264]